MMKKVLFTSAKSVRGVLTILENTLFIMISNFRGAFPYHVVKNYTLNY